MTPKKVYYYDYHTTLDVEPQKTQEIPVKPSEPSIQRSNFLPTILIIALVVAIAYLSYSLIPKNYQSCSTFPGSKITSIYPGTCTTFYGKSFAQTLAVAEETTSPEVIPTYTPTPTSTSTAIGDEPSIPTTKGGLPLETPAPTPTPKTTKSTTSAPKLSPGSNTGSSSIPDDWTKHRYPTQKIVIQLPNRFTSSNVTRNNSTGISTFTIYDGSNQVINAILLPNWVGTNNANSHPITFMITDNTGVIKLTNGNDSVYYFEKFGLVYSFTCQIDSATCDTIIKSIEFSQ